MNNDISTQVALKTKPWSASSKPLWIDSSLSLDVGQLHEPTPQLPSFIHIKLELAWGAAKEELRRRLSNRAPVDPDSLREAITVFIDRVIATHKLYQGHAVIKVKPGKTAASRQCYLKVRPVLSEEYPGSPMVNAPKASGKWVYAPTTLVHFEGNLAHLPLWLVKHKMDELGKRSTHRNVTWRYELENEIVWLGSDSFRAFIETQLPTDLLAHCLRVKAQMDAQALHEQQRQRERAISMDEGRSRREAEVKIAAAAQMTAKAKTMDKLNALPGWIGVNVEYCDWEKKGGNLTRIEKSATNVTVRQSGLRAYVIFEDGSMFFKPTKNVKVTDSGGNALAFSG